jgi:hypothetical protein
VGKSPQPEHEDGKTEPGRRQPHRQERRHQQRSSDDAAADTRDDNPTARAALGGRKRALDRRPGERHQDSPRQAGGRAPEREPRKASVPRASREGERREPHAGVERAGRSDAPRQRSPAEHADEIAGEVHRP